MKIITIVFSFLILNYITFNLWLHNFTGYYAEQLSSDDIVLKTDIRNSSTSIHTTKTTKKSSHIYKLSYAGPIVMGVGGNL